MEILYWLENPVLFEATFNKSTSIAVLIDDDDRSSFPCFSLNSPLLISFLILMFDFYLAVLNVYE